MGEADQWYPFAIAKKKSPEIEKNVPKTQQEVSSGSTGDVMSDGGGPSLLLPCRCGSFTVRAALYFLIYHRRVADPSRVYRLCPVSRAHGALEEAH